MAPHQDYSAELARACRRGHPIANPQPGIGSDGRPLRPIDVGDVGYISHVHGNFIRMFNVHLEPGVDGQPELDDLPDEFELLPKRQISLLHDKTPVFKSRSISVQSISANASGPFLGGSVAFSASSECGAILATPDPIECHDAQHILSYKEYAKTNIESWHEFAVQKLGLEIALEDIIFVTGVDRTTSWATAVFTDTHLDAKFGLEVQYAGAGVQLAAQFSWRHTQGALVNSGPTHYRRRPLGELDMNVNRREPNSKPLNEACDQSLFIRHIRGKRRRWLGLKLKANGEAEEEDDSDDDSDDESASGDILLTCSPKRQKFTDCLDPVLDLILEHSDSDIAIAHYDDLDLLSDTMTPLVEVHGGFGSLRVPSAPSSQPVAPPGLHITLDISSPKRHPEQEGPSPKPTPLHEEPMPHIDELRVDDSGQDARVHDELRCSTPYEYDHERKSERKRLSPAILRPAPARSIARDPARRHRPMGSYTQSFTPQPSTDVVSSSFTNDVQRVLHRRNDTSAHPAGPSMSYATPTSSAMANSGGMFDSRHSASELNERERTLVLDNGHGHDIRHQVHSFSSPTALRPPRERHGQSRLQMLRTGIDAYESGDINSLRGTVSNANELDKFLRTELRVLSARVVDVRNDVATLRARQGRDAREDNSISAVPFSARPTAAAMASTNPRDHVQPATHESRGTTWPWVNEDGGPTKLLCRALYDHSSMDENTLSFRRGAVIEVLSRLESGWWDGVLDDKRGWFPSNYVQVLGDDVAETALATVESASPSLGRTHSTHKVHAAFTSRYAPDAMSYMRHPKKTIHKESDSLLSFSGLVYERLESTSATSAIATTPSLATPALADGTRDRGRMDLHSDSQLAAISSNGLFEYVDCHKPVVFSSLNPTNIVGILLSEALEGGCEQLCGYDDVLFEHHTMPISVRVDWPEHPPQPVRVTPPHPVHLQGRITRAMVATKIAQVVQQSIEEADSARLNDNADTRGVIADASQTVIFEDLALVRLEPLPDNVWRAQLCFIQVDDGSAEVVDDEYAGRGKPLPTY